MINGEEKVIGTTEVPVIEDNTKDYIEEIQKLKEGTVSKEEYMKLKEENKKLINSLATGEGFGATPAAPIPDVDNLRNKLFNSEGLSNLDYCTTAIELREALIASGKPDPFLPVGHEIVPTASDIESAERVAQNLKECIDYAQGNSDIFTDELQRRLVDSTPRRRK